MRNDAGVEAGAEIAIYYDPMIAKLIVHGRDRAEALRRLARALAELRVEGIRTNAPLFEVLRHDDVRAPASTPTSSTATARGGRAQGARARRGLRLPLVAAAIAHFERAQRVAAGSDGRASRRSAWREAARHGALRRGAWS